MTETLETLRRVVALTLCLFVAGCAPITPEAGAGASAPASTETPAPEEAAVEIPTVTIELTEAGVSVPAEVPSGIVRFRFVSVDPDMGGIDVARLVERTTMDELEEALAGAGGNPAPALELVRIYGYSGSTDEAIYDLMSGEYVVVYNAGMPDESIATFSTGADSGAPEPEADVVVELNDFAFVMPDEIAAGPQLWEFVNQGEQWHMMLITRLAEGQTVEDIMGFLANPEEADAVIPDFVAAYSPISQGNRAWVTMDLPAGDYIAICPLPDLAGEMMDHASKGMVRQFTVK